MLCLHIIRAILCSILIRVLVAREANFKILTVLPEVFDEIQSFGQIRSEGVCRMLFLSSTNPTVTTFHHDTDTGVCRLGRVVGNVPRMMPSQGIRVHMSMENEQFDTAPHLLVFNLNLTDASTKPSLSPPIPYDSSWFPNWPYDRKNGAITHYQGGILFCGGANPAYPPSVFFRECFHFLSGRESNPVEYSPMMHARLEPVMGRVRGQPWVGGGSSQPPGSPGELDYAKTSEILDLATNSWLPSKELPTDIHKDCFVEMNDEETKHLLVAGLTGQSWTIDWDGAEVWVPAGGPATQRKVNTCARVKVEGGTREVIVVAGGANPIVGVVDIFDIQSESWINGPPLPGPRSFGCLLTINLDKTRLVYLGGQADDGTFLTTAVEMRDDMSGWDQNVEMSGDKVYHYSKCALFN